MGLSTDLIAELQHELRPMLLISGRSAYIGIGGAPEVARWITDHQLTIIGFEGFDCDGEHLYPRLDFIADFSELANPEESSRAATALLTEWRGQVQWIDFVVAPTR